jgi:hypothetical protein
VELIDVTPEKLPTTVRTWPEKGPIRHKRRTGMLAIHAVSKVNFGNPFEKLYVIASEILPYVIRGR